MTSQPLPEITDQTADWARPLYGQQIGMLGELAGQGLEIGRQVVRVAKDAWCVDGAHTATLAHTRVARAVRLTLMLQARVIKALEDRDAGRRSPPQAPVVDERRDKRARTLRAVEQIAGQDAREGGEIDRLVREAAERLDADDADALLDRPMSELVALICKDLGLDPGWPRLAEEAWARDEIANGKAGWPPVPPRPACGERIEERGRASARRKDALPQPPDLSTASQVHFPSSRTLAPSP